jgi:hypothetical protein
MATFANTLSPTPFGFFDENSAFQSEADKMVTFVKRKLGDDILSVELTKKQIWACFEESFCEYGSIINQYQARSDLLTLMGYPTGSTLSGSQNRLPRGNFEFLLRRAEPYAAEAGFGGSFNTMSGSIQLSKGVQDYDIYENLKDGSGNLIFSSSQNASTGTNSGHSRSRLKILEVFHFNPQAAYRFFDTTSAINYLNNEFVFESFTPETVFYVLPIFEDVLRGGQMDMSNRVRRSNYSYETAGTNIRIFPQPSAEVPKKLWIRVGFTPNPFDPAYRDETIDGVSNLSNVPFGVLEFNKINSMGHQWVRQYTLGGAKELLGLVRSKFSAVPIPGGDLQLNGTDLVTQGREEKEKLKTELKEMLENVTYSKLIETQAAEAENLRKLLLLVPIPNGKAIVIG